MNDKKKILLCVTGGVAIYKSLELIRLLKQNNIEVQVALSHTAQKLIAPFLFETISQQKVLTSLLDQLHPDKIQHIEIAQSVDLIVVAPATANIIGKVANGIADELISTTLLAANAPVIFAPAMNDKMWENTFLQNNIAKLKKAGAIILEPQKDFLACGSYGFGKMQNPEFIANFIQQYIEDNKSQSAKKPLKNKKALITLGATREYLDPFRFISNGSSGKMGLAVAEALAEQGATIALIYGDVKEPIPSSWQAIKASTTDSMRQKLKEQAAEYDIIVMCAAISDYKPDNYKKNKIKQREIKITMQKTTDIIAELGKQKKCNQVLVGFSAETENIEENAKKKLNQKNLDLIYTNLITKDSGFGSEYSTYQILSSEKVGKIKHKPKKAGAKELIQWIQLKIKEKEIKLQSSKIKN